MSAVSATRARSKYVSGISETLEAARKGEPRKRSIPTTEIRQGGALSRGRLFRVGDVASRAQEGPRRLVVGGCDKAVVSGLDDVSEFTGEDPGHVQEVFLVVVKGEAVGGAGGPESRIP